jgi:hypothetical protein
VNALLIAYLPDVMNLFRYITSRTLTFKSSVVTICTRGLTFNSSAFCPQCIYVFCVDLRTNSDYFPININ